VFTISVSSLTEAWRHVRHCLMEESARYWHSFAATLSRIDGL